MPENKATLPEIKVKYEKHHDYKIVPISGAYGSINPQGMIVCDFYFEKVNAPDGITLKFDQKTQLPIESEPENVSKPLVREFLIGVAMPPEVAKGLSDWLKKKYDDYTKLMDNK